jgi:hypothetical protein
MGDIKTHAAIADKIIASLERLRPGEDYIYFELGNWLTDMSQFRDPFAYTSAKPVIWKQAKTKSIAARLPFVLDAVAKLDDYLDELMGVPGQDGALTKWFKEIIFAAGLEKFRKLGVDVQEFKEIYEQNWTQYFPHEHLDFPPWPIDNFLGDRAPSAQALHTCITPPAQASGSGRAPRKLLAYLEEQIVYLSDLFTVIDKKWADLPLTPANAKERHKVLARFGHASHAVEDFFFHSNFVETAWALNHNGKLEDNTRPIKDHRIFFRRLQAPVSDGVDKPSRQTSTRSEYIYTGFFGSKDVFHTIMDGIKGFADELRDEKHLPEPMIKKIGDIANPGDTEQEQEQQLREHRQNLQDGNYVTLARLFRHPRSGEPMHPDSISAIERACQIDYDLGEKYPKIAPEVRWGVYGLLQQFGIEAKKEVRESEAASAGLDSQNLIEDVRTANSFIRSDGTEFFASAETIGSHTLMSKDSERKFPLREEAIKLATCTALYIARRMVEDERNWIPAARDTLDAPPSSVNTVETKYLDWLHLLQHFLAHPTESEGAPGSPNPWWKDAMSNENAPDYHTLAFINQAELNRRLREELRPQLEARYNELAVTRQREWESLIGSGRAVDTGIILGAVAGAIAGAIIGAAAGGLLGAIIGAVVGAVAGALVGAGIGALVGALL